MISSHCFAVVSATLMRSITAAELTSTSSRPNRSTTATGEGARCIGVGEVGTERRRAMTRRLEFRHQLLGLSGRAAVVHRDVHPPLRQRDRKGAAEPTGTAGHEGHAPREFDAHAGLIAGRRCSRGGSHSSGTSCDPSRECVPIASSSPCQSDPPVRPRPSASAASVIVARVSPS